MSSLGRTEITADSAGGFGGRTCLRLGWIYPVSHFLEFWSKQEIGNRRHGLLQNSGLRGSLLHFIPEAECGDLWKNWPPRAVLIQMSGHSWGITHNAFQEAKDLKFLLKRRSPVAASRSSPCTVERHKGCI